MTLYRIDKPTSAGYWWRIEHAKSEIKACLVSRWGDLWHDPQPMFGRTFAPGYADDELVAVPYDGSQRGGIEEVVPVHRISGWLGPKIEILNEQPAASA